MPPTTPTVTNVLLLVVDATLHVVLKLTKPRLEVVACDALLRHHRLSFCKVFFFEIRHAARPIIARLATKANRYGTIVIQLPLNGLAELVLHHPQQTRAPTTHTPCRAGPHRQRLLPSHLSGALDGAEGLLRGVFLDEVDDLTD